LAVQRALYIFVETLKIAGNTPTMEVQMKRLCFVALLAFSGLVFPSVSAHAFGIFGSWWSIDETDTDGWGGGIRQEIPLLPWGKDHDDDYSTSTTTYGDSVVTHHEHDDDDDYKADESLLRLSLDTRLSYVRFTDESAFDNDLDVVPIEIGALVGLGVLYAEIGGGYYFMNADIELENAWGWFALAGVTLGKGTKGLFGEIMWRSLTSDFEDVDVDLGDLPDSLDAAGIGVNVGISFGI
jgi:hypothetical protein